ncbi:hypothetical protein N2152v2_006718 [Parachlorella kessleri]
MTLWDSVQRLINSAKDVADMSLQELFNLEGTFSYRFIMDNSPEGISQSLLKIVDMETWLAVDKLNQVGRVTWVFLGIEAGLIIPLCAIYLIRLLYKVAIERFNLFSVFLFIPRPAVLALARAQIVVDEMDDSEDDEEEVGAGVDLAAASGAISTAVSQKVLAQKAAQYDLINSSKERVMALDLSERVLYFQTGLWYAATPLNGPESSDTLHLRSKLIDTATRAKFYYELGLYGQDNPDKPLNQSYNTMYYFLELSIYFANTNSSAIGINNPVVQYGLSAAPDADDVANFDIVRAIQGVVLAVALVWPLAYLYFLAVPYVRLTLLESRRVAEVLSYLPQGVDLASLIQIANSNLVKQAVPAASNTGGKATARRASAQSADEEYD